MAASQLMSGLSSSVSIPRNASFASALEPNTSGATATAAAGASALTFTWGGRMEAVSSTNSW
jgi:hypothetical protein